MQRAAGCPRSFVSGCLKSLNSYKRFANCYQIISCLGLDASFFGSMMQVDMSFCVFFAIQGKKEQ